MLDNSLSPDQMGLFADEMKTPEQRAKEASQNFEDLDDVEGTKRLEEYRRMSEPMIGYLYPEGKTPFGLPRDEVIARAAERTFPQVESAELKLNAEFLQDVVEVLDDINDQSGKHYALGEYALGVFSYHLALARGESSEFDISQAAFLETEFNKYLKSATGETLDDWAKKYAEGHSEDIQFADTNRFLKIHNADFESHKFNGPNLTKLFTEHLTNNDLQSLTPDEALEILISKGYIVPSEWKEDYADNEDGKVLLEAIDNAERKNKVAEVISVLGQSFEDLPAEELKSMQITVGDVLAVASFDVETLLSWNDCDEPTKKTVTDILKQLATNLGGSFGKSKGEPVVKFK